MNKGVNPLFQRSFWRGMTDKLDPGDRLFTGVILSIVRACWACPGVQVPDYSIIIGEAQGVHSFHDMIL